MRILGLVCIVSIYLLNLCLLIMNAMYSILEESGYGEYASRRSITLHEVSLRHLSCKLPLLSCNCSVNHRITT